MSARRDAGRARLGGRRVAGLGPWLWSRAVAVVPMVVALVFVALVLLASGASGDMALLVCGMVALAFVTALLVAYARGRSWWAGLADLSCEADNPRLVSQMAEEPVLPEQRLAADVLDQVTRSANDEVAEYRRQMREYREYVETWVHEAKSPLAAANLMLDNLAADPRSLADDPVRLEALGDELHRVGGYIEQALFFARSESLERDYVIRRHRLRDVVGAALRESSRELIAAHVAPRLGEGLDLEVLTDEKWLAFVIGQLLQNTVRYVRPDAEGGAFVSFSAMLLDEGRADERVRLVVADNGCGTSAADLPRVFERGFTGDNGRTHKQSTGLGLWLVARLCDKMGVAVSAESEAGRSFSVVLEFPSNKMHYFE